MIDGRLDQLLWSIVEVDTDGDSSAAGLDDAVRRDPEHVDEHRPGDSPVTPSSNVARWIVAANEPFAASSMDAQQRHRRWEMVLRPMSETGTTFDRSSQAAPTKWAKHPPLRLS